MMTSSPILAPATMTVLAPMNTLRPMDVSLPALP